MTLLRRPLDPCRASALVLFALLAAAGARAQAEDAAEPIRVYVLAGQSNMEGKARVSVIERQLEDPKTAALWQFTRASDGWAERDDVVIDFLAKRGPATVGFGSPGCIGPELGFVRVVGDHHAAPVLVIKTAWGGRSLWRDFRSPSAGLPPDDVLDELVERARQKEPATTRADIEASFGSTYREMLAEVRATLVDVPTIFPEHAERPVELAGFVWFQGWNDMLDARATAEYTANMVHFVRDVRRDLGAPELPFVIGQFGVDGKDNDHPKHLRFKAAQAAAADEPTFAGNVLVVPTDEHWDEEAQAMFDAGGDARPEDRPDGWAEQWDRLGSNKAYHYLGSPRTMLGVGEAFGRAVLALERLQDEENQPK